MGFLRAILLPGTVALLALPQVTLQAADEENGRTVTWPPKTARHRPNPATIPIAHRMQMRVDRLDLTAVTAREAMDTWSAATNIPLVVHWPALEAEGVDPESEVSLSLRGVPAGVLLKLILNQFAVDVKFIIERTPWYVEVLTREHALRNPVIRIYDINDLLHEVPNFDRAPSFDLSEALSNTNSGGGGGGRNSGGSGGGGNSGSNGIFGDTDRDDERRERPSRADRAGDIMQLLRDTIEPDIWIENGGQYCSIRYYDGRLIVNAPLYVHRLIGAPAVRSNAPARASAYHGSPGSRRHRDARTSRTVPYRRPTNWPRRGISGVVRQASSGTSGIAR